MVTMHAGSVVEQTDVLPGFVYLRRPRGSSLSAGRQQHALAAAVHGSEGSEVESRGTAESGAAPVIPGASSVRDTTVAPGEQDASGVVELPPRAFLLHCMRCWLEFLQGLRTIQGLQRGPFAPLVVRESLALRARLGTRVALEVQGLRVASLHISAPYQSQRSRRQGRVRFCATILVAGNVRTVVGECSAISGGAVREVQQQQSAKRSMWRIDRLALVGLS